MADDDHETGLSGVGRSFVAGQLWHAPALYAVLATT